MYCVSCGTAVTPGLSYCNRCGANLSRKDTTANWLTRMAVENLVWAIVAMATLGIGAAIALIGLLKHYLNLPDMVIIAIAFLGATPFLGAEILFIIMLMRAISTKPVHPAPQLQHPLTKELENAPVRELPEPAMSVVEQTTRTLEAVPRHRKPD
jgi:hypothetical protein